MIVKNIFKIIVGLTSIATCVKAADGCKEIEAKLKDKSVTCEEKGKFIDLEIGHWLTDSEFDYVFSIDSIKTLTIKAGDDLKGFEKLKNLEELNLAGVNDSNLKGIGKLKTLKRLNLKMNNQITKLPDEIGDLENLEYLNLGDNYLYDLPKSLGNLKNLKELYTRENNFNSTMPAAIFSLYNLEKLNVGSSSITKIPKEIKNLKKLVELRAQNNQISEIADLGSLQNLKYLVLSNNKLKKFPKGLENLKNLEVLNLSWNQIDEEIPESLNNLPNLKYFYVSGNENIRGKTLSNDKLEECGYIETNNLCKAKDMECLKDYSFKSCSSSTDNEISKNGECGKGKGKCPSGECCSKYGYCGTSDKHCKTGCQSEFGTCKTNEDDKISTNGECGKGKGKCPAGKCCSKYGYCGTSDKHCKAGCQSEFGTCKTNEDDKISTNGECGKGKGKCPAGECCSKYGYCGTSDKHCKTGCQSEFGTCKSSSEKISTNGRCGKEDGKCPSGKCCSKYGWCGTSDQHCKASQGCQKSFGECH